MTNPIKVVCQNAGLIRQLSRREILERYKGSMFGLLWSFLNPILMLLVYLFVFSFVFKLRWQGTAGHAQFGTVLFAGLILHALLGECLSRAPGLILGNAQFVKKVVFPLEIFSIVSVVTALFHFSVSMLILIIAHLLTSHEVNWTIIFVPIVVLPLALIGLGLSYLIASTTVFIRDLSQVIGVLVTVLLFLSPIFYPLEAVPETVRPLMYLNPLTVPISEFRNLVLWGKTPDLVTLAVYTIVALIVFYLGWWWFQRTKKVFADVL